MIRLKYTIEKESAIGSEIDAEESAQIFLEWIRSLKAQARECRSDGESPRVVLASATTNSPLVAEIECDESVQQADRDIADAVESGHLHTLADSAQKHIHALRKALSKGNCRFIFPVAEGRPQRVSLTGGKGIEGKPVIRSATTIYGDVVSLSYTDPHVRIRIGGTASTIKVRLSKQDASWLARRQPETVMLSGVADVIACDGKIVRFACAEGGLNRDFDASRDADEVLSNLRAAFKPLVDSGSLKDAVDESMALRKGEA